MAKITKKQKEVYNRLFDLFHQLIRIQMTGNKEQFDSIIAQIKDAIEEV